MFDRRTLLGGLATLPLALSACRKSSQHPISNAGPSLFAPLFLGDEQPPYIEQLGHAYDSITFSDQDLFLSGKRIQTTVNPDDYRPNLLDMAVLENQYDYRSRIDRSLRAKAKYGIFKAKGSVSSSHEEATSSYSIHVCTQAIRHQKTQVFDADTVAPATRISRFLAKNRKNKPLLLKTFRDSYVASATPTSELFIDLVFETASFSSREELRGSIKASVGGLGSAKGGYSQLMNEARGHKSAKIFITGLDGSQIPAEYSPAEVREIVTKFFQDDSRPAYALMEHRSFANMVLDDQKVDWVNQGDLAVRGKFARQALNAVAMLDNVIVDATYVKSNPDEFAEDVRSRAADDLDHAILAQNDVADLSVKVFADFGDTGVTNGAFDPKNVDQLVPKFLPYAQKERIVVSPGSTTTPAPAPARDCCSDAHGAGGGMGGTRLW